MSPMSPVERLRHRARALLRRLRPRRDPLVVGLRGDLTADTVDDTRRVLLAALREAPEVLEIDVSRVTHLDPDGALALLLTARAAGDQGTRVSVTHARAQVTAVMRRTGLERYLAHGRSAR